MTLTDYRDTFAWRQGLELGPHLVRVAEQLPESEAAGLSLILRNFAVEAPGSIAADLVTGSHHALPVMLRIVAALEVIERVYPALDTTAARNAADALATRVEGGGFTEQETAPVAAEAESSDDDDTTDTTDTAVTMVEPEPLEPAPAPAAAATPAPTVATTPEPEPAATAAPAPAPEPSTVQLTPTAEPAPTVTVPIVDPSLTPTPGDPTVVPTNSPQ